MTQPHAPDVAFGAIPDVGLAAAVADDDPFLDEVLRRHGFAYCLQRDVYLLPPDTEHQTAVQAVASATRTFQIASLSVAADPRVVALTPSGTGAVSEEAQPLDRSHGLHADHAARFHAATVSSPHRRTAPAKRATPWGPPPEARPSSSRRAR